MTWANFGLFYNALTLQYEHLFANDPDYAFVARKMTPTDLARKMTTSLSQATASKDGLGIKNTCKALGIKHTYSAIENFLNA